MLRLGGTSRLANQTNIFTVGHSNHSAEGLVSLLRRHGITVVADVRSVPYSRRYPHFSRDALNASLIQRGFQYKSLGRWLGGRSDDPVHYDDDGRVRYDVLAQSELFEAGIESLLRGSEEHTIALMCAEARPEDCHRAILIGQHLADAFDIQVEHILPNGASESHSEMCDRLAGLDQQPSMFTRAESVSAALQRQAEKVAYVDVARADRIEDFDLAVAV